jgi:hypothetical protein
MTAARLTARALNRALLARQGLLERRDARPVEAVEAIGAVQAQHWPAPGAALWSRLRGFAAADLHDALARGELVVGTLLRRTIHLVSAREHPEYAAVAEAFGAHDWRRVADRSAPPSPAEEALRAALLEHAAVQPRSGEDVDAFVEAWIAAHPGAIDAAEAEHQRTYKWRALRSSSAFLRVPCAGASWGRTPACVGAAPAPPAADLDAAIDAVLRRHLRAFGPAGAEDVAHWIKWRIPAVRAALRRLEPDLVRLEDEAGRALYDLPDAPRPDPDAPAPVRLLPWFDSVLLAYAPAHRARILPDAHRDAVYQRANLQIRPTFLVNGLVAGTWTVDTRRREAVLALRPLERLTVRARRSLTGEAEGMIAFLAPDAAAHGVVIAD